VATLAGTHLLPVSGLQCGLDSQWQNLFQAANGNAIRRVQDALNCCGLHGLDDMAWPFHGNGTCQALTGRTQSCFLAWRKEEQEVAGMVLLVVVMAFAWKVSLDIIALAVADVSDYWLDVGSGQNWRHQMGVDGSR
jgi:hypothetical protein